MQGSADCHLLERDTLVPEDTALKTAQLLIQILSRCFMKNCPIFRKMCLSFSLKIWPTVINDTIVLHGI